MNISIGKDESLRTFGRRFVAEAKSLAKLCSLTPRELATALARAIKPFPYLDIFRSKLIGPIDSKTVLRIAKTLSTYKAVGGSYPNRNPKVFHSEQVDEEEAEIYYSQPQQPPKGVCHYCRKEGH